jgi:hypothetical protein
MVDAQTAVLSGGSGPAGAALKAAEDGSDSDGSKQENRYTCAAFIFFIFVVFNLANFFIWVLVSCAAFCSPYRFGPQLHTSALGFHHSVCPAERFVHEVQRSLHRTPTCC